MLVVFMIDAVGGGTQPASAMTDKTAMMIFIFMVLTPL